jgi:hypothetical protein
MGEQLTVVRVLLGCDERRVLDPSATIVIRKVAKIRGGE